jgi:hypothetical protein
MKTLTQSQSCYDSRVVFNKHWKPYLQGLDRKINGDGGTRRDSR